MGQKLANNASGTLAANISTGDTTITLTAGHGSRFPSLSTGEYFYATLADLAENIEIVKVTARNNDILTVVRAQDGTTAKAYQAGALLELRPTRVLLQSVAQEASVAISLSGTNSYTGTLSPAPQGYETNQIYWFRFTNTNTSTSPTVNLNGFGAVNLRRHDGESFLSHEIPTGVAIPFVYTGSEFRSLPTTFSEPFAVPSNHPTVTDWKTNPNSQISNWAQFSKALNLLVSNTRKHGLLACVPINIGTLSGGGAFRGGVLMLDGRVFIVPHYSTTARIYDPVTDTFTTPSGTYPGSAAFSGGVLLRDGRVFLTPAYSTTARIYDPRTDTVTTPSGTYPGNDAFSSAVLLADGRVFLAPYNGTTARIYDPATDTLITPTGTYWAGAYNGAVLLPDGRVFLVPHDSTVARIYDPVTDTVTVPSGTYPGNNALAGGILLPDGRVFCAPSNGTTARIYDPATDTLTTPGGTYPGNYAHLGGVLLPDGRVFLIPSFGNTARIYDPITDTVTTPPGTYPGSNAYNGGVVLPDGRVFFVPYNATTVFITTGTSFTRVPSGIATSPFHNKFL